MNMSQIGSGMSREEAAANGMIIAFHASVRPDAPAFLSEAGNRTYAELNARANQLTRALRRAGLKEGDAVALLCSNRPEFAETASACQRGGFRLTPVNWHLKGNEVGYIVDNCEAKAFVADARFKGSAIEAAAMSPGILIGLSVGGDIDGFTNYDKAVGAEKADNISDPVLGTQMMYTSGTTGYPKGVFRREAAPVSPLLVKLTETAQFKDGDLALVTGPLYHAAPLALNLNFPLNSGIGCVVMDKWDAEETLRLVQEYKITHTHVVPTMLHRILSLTPEVRAKYDFSSLRWILHGAAPCPTHVKERSIDMFGPVVFEYYAATEGGGIFVDSHEWKNKSGTVGKPLPGVVVRVVNDNGEAAKPREVGTIYFEAPATGRFEYFKAPEKTEGAYRGNDYTMGDMGYLDEDGFLYLTGRSAEVIIAGGVNIYPVEIDQEVLEHPAVYDVAVVGVPNEEWGEEIKAVVQLNEGYTASDKLAAEIVAFAAERLPGYKRPRSVDFTDDLPRMPSGKIVRRTVRDRYWQGEKKI
ncbi:MAG: AMP-binding protein [Parvibaculaceae bacterium]